MEERVGFDKLRKTAQLTEVLMWMRSEFAKVEVLWNVNIKMKDSLLGKGWCFS